MSPLPAIEDRPVVGRSPRNGLVVRLARLTRARRELSRAVGGNIEHLTWEESALLLRHIKAEVTQLQAAVTNVEARIIRGRIDAGIFEDTEVPGVGVVTVHRTKDRKAWDHAAVAAHVVEEHLAEHAGELPTPWEVRDWIMDAAGVAYWRVTALKALGLDADNFCEVTKGRRVVQIIGGPDL